MDEEKRQVRDGYFILDKAYIVSEARQTSSSTGGHQIT